MPPSWSSRFLSGVNSSNSNTNGSGSTPTRNTPNRLNSREKPLPRPPSTAYEEPTLSGRDGERSLPPMPPATQGSPQRPKTDGGRHTHTRSVSHPLPKIFGRKKSAGQLGTVYHDTDVPLDDELVPVLADDSASATPTRVVSGKKGGQATDDGDKATRNCMCCDARVKVPRDLSKFRCMSCYTVNDLKPVENQLFDKEEKQAAKRAEIFPAGMPSGLRPLPLSLERTRAIIDRCILTYLEVRCRREESANGKKVRTPLQTPEEKENPMNNVPVRSRQASGAVRQLKDEPVSSSPPDTPQQEEPSVPASAAIRDFSDFDLFAYQRTNTPPPGGRVVPQGPGPPTSVPRKPVPAPPNRKPPPPPMDISKRAPSQRHLPSGNQQNGETSPKFPPSPRPTPHEIEQRRRYDRAKTIFRPLEDYIVASFGDYRCLNSSFSTLRPIHTGRARSESNIVTPPSEPVGDHHPSLIDLSQLDAKTLLLGDIGENSSWWSGKLDRKQSDKAAKRKKSENARRPVNSRSPNIDWNMLDSWYETVRTAGDQWQSKIHQLKSPASAFCKDRLEGFDNVEEISDDLAEAREHAIRALLKVTENILKRPSRPLIEPEHIRFLLIILANPSLYPALSRSQREMPRASSNPTRSFSAKQGGPDPSLEQSPRKAAARDGTQHTGILKRILGLLANSSDACHRYLIGWFARLDEEHLVRIIDLVGSFVTHRITRQQNRPQNKTTATDGGLIPDLSGSAMNTSQQLHAAMGLGGSAKKRANESEQDPDYSTDWQIKVAAKVMSLLFAANNVWQGRRKGERIDLLLNAHTGTPPARAKRSGQLLHTSTFYNTLLDYLDVIGDFKMWESRRDRFAFCQYPLFLSMGNKIKILEYDARRQMEIKAREAYFDSVIRQRALDGYFHLRVRRDCMVDDSLRQISEAVGAGQEELKKGLRVHFTGEEGVDAGGPRKEWFLMIVRDIFDPNYGMFVYDDDSQTCYFNPNAFETSDQYHLVGALLGLAIYNSTILDVALPPFAFRKLLAAAPAASAGTANISSITGTKGQMTYTLSDLAEFRPSLAAGLQQLLDFDGDVQDTYAWDFVAPIERYGVVTNVPLISNGEATPVTNANRQEFVDAYVRYLLDTAVSRQFEPFKRGFFHVCAGNALSLFRAEEIELLIRGSDEALAVEQLSAVAVYENWKHPLPPHPPAQRPADDIPVIQWFWELFAQATPAMQRKLLSFITGTDRIPAVGATSLILRIVAGGDGWGGGGKEERERFPVARTCFNMLVLWRYQSREQLEEKLWRAVEESEGFGLK